MPASLPVSAAVEFGSSRDWTPRSARASGPASQPATVLALVSHNEVCTGSGSKLRCDASPTDLQLEGNLLRRKMRALCIGESLRVKPKALASRMSTVTLKPHYE